MENDHLAPYTSFEDAHITKKNYAKMYAEQVLKMNDPLYEIEWLFSRLDKEEQENLIEIFDLNAIDNE